MSSTSRELQHIAHSIPQLLRSPDDLPTRERIARISGLPVHFIELIALGSLRFIPAFAFETGIEEPGAGATEKPAVMLVHGYAGHPKSHSLLGRALHRAGRPTHSVDLREAGNVEGMARCLADKMQAFVESCGPTHIVAHSLGGLVARLALEESSFSDMVRSLVTLGTPNEGTHVADIIDSTLADTLEADSDLAQRLERQEPWDDDDKPPLVCLWSKSDLLMVPPRAALADGARKVPVGRVSHYGYLLRPRISRLVIEILDELDRAADADERAAR